MDGQSTIEHDRHISDVFPKVTVSNEIKLLIASEEPDKILTYILTNMDIMRQQLSILMPMVSEINREAKKTNGKIIKLQEWKEEYENLLPDTILAVNDHERMIKTHSEKLNTMETKVDVHHSALIKSNTIRGFIAKTAVAAAGSIAAFAAMVEIFHYLVK